jgi:RHS repeat-associated protein
MTTDVTGSLAGIKRHDYLPFGEEIGGGVGGRTTNQGYVADSIRQKFTGYERDGETGLDYAQARYYANVQGRFTSVDPENAGAYTNEPQSWNAYAYVHNNPLAFIDPLGLERCSRKNEDGGCDQWVGDYDGERSKEISGGIYNDGAYWNKKAGIWETRAQFRDRMSENPLWAISLHMQRMERPMTRTILGVTAANALPAVVIVGSGSLAGVGSQTLGLLPGTSAAVYQSSLARLSIQQLNALIKGRPKDLLSEWFGSAPEGARQALTKPVPAGLTREHLIVAREIAQRAIDSVIKNKNGVQTIRLKAINEALKRMP